MGFDINYSNFFSVKMKDITEIQIVESQIIRHKKAILCYWIMDLSHVFWIRGEACERFCNHTAQLDEKNGHFYYCYSFYSNGCCSHRFYWFVWIFLFSLFILQKNKTSVSFLSNTEVFNREQNKTLLKRPYARVRKFLCRQNDLLITSVYDTLTRYETSHVDRTRTAHFIIIIPFLNIFKLRIKSNTVYPPDSDFMSCMCHVFHLMACHYW